jgi:hypothetical protein
MPDISGFTSFVKEVEIRHSKHIVTELIQLLIKENKDRLILAEIEGDALFYYQIEEKISPTGLIETVQSMYDKFHAHLDMYRFKRICNCGACSKANELELKFVIHIGETEQIEINGTSKPFGPDVITLHRLLKNKIKTNEYILFSEDYWLKNKVEIQNILGSNSDQISEKYDFGDYSYVNFPLKRKKSQELKAAKIPQLEGISPLKLNISMNAEPNDLFQYVVDLNKRIEWSPGLDDLKFDHNILNSQGVNHTCVINGKNVDVKTIFANSNKKELIYIEETFDVPLLNSVVTLFRILPKESGAKIEVEAYLKATSFFGKVMRPLIKVQLKKNMLISLLALKENMEV